jgi:hypothetical protein
MIFILSMAELSRHASGCKASGLATHEHFRMEQPKKGLEYVFGGLLAE